MNPGTFQLCPRSPRFGTPCKSGNVSEQRPPPCTRISLASSSLYPPPQSVILISTPEPAPYYFSLSTNEHPHCQCHFRGSEMAGDFIAELPPSASNDLTVCPFMSGVNFPNPRVRPPRIQECVRRLCGSILSSIASLPCIPIPSLRHVGEAKCARGSNLL